MLLEWNRDLDIGHERIDAQHRSLVGLLNRLHQDRLSGTGARGIRPVLAELHRYVLFHFGQEEALMHAAGYSRQAEHEAEHRQFADRLEALCARHLQGDEGVPAETFNWLAGWLLDHIAVQDRALGACLAK
jgi:hemerythrin-like metal-binding protein